jgi:hypothetical protein
MCYSSSNPPCGPANQLLLLPLMLPTVLTLPSLLLVLLSLPPLALAAATSCEVCVWH